jgi:DNA-binding LytR/AlgR family response regulator
MALHVLVLEDEYMLRNVLRDVILAFDRDIVLKQFYNSDDAAKYVEENGDSIDLYIRDVRVPGKLNGAELAVRIREVNSTGAIVLTSAYKPPEPELLESLSAYWYPKPWHIMETTKHLLEIAKARRFSADNT